MESRKLYSFSSTIFILVFDQPRVSDQLRLVTDKWRRKKKDDKISLGTDILVTFGPNNLYIHDH